MPLYAIVEFSNMTVANIDNRSSAPPVPPGFRTIVDSDWAPDAPAMIGYIWEGTFPARFNPPVIEDVPTDLQGIIDKIAAIQAELDKVVAGASSIQGA
jgi:hypothetical protein